MESSYAEAVDRQKQDLLEVFEARKRARSVVVPTDDTQVKVRLRELDEPICLFGEGPADRRERLRQLIAEIVESGIATEQKEEKDEQPVSDIPQDSVWYHEGPSELEEARLWIAKYSVSRAKERLEASRQERLKPSSHRAAKRQETHKQLRSLTNLCSQVGDNRPISFCQFSPDSKLLATASWSGLCKLWSVPECNEVRVLRGHNERVGAIVFHPQATLSQSTTSLNMASCAADGTVCLWDLEQETPLDDLDNHGDRVGRVAFHPSGRFLGTTCFDNSWRLWDLEAKQELLFQEGHSRNVYDIAFHPDGSLCGTSAFDGCARLWDVRSGKCVLLLDGHLKGVLTVGFSPLGVYVGTGGDDNVVRMWDIRQKKCVYTIPAHTNLVSYMKFQDTQSHYLVTSSYDNTAKVWAHPGWTPLKTLSGHVGKVMAVDISKDDKYIATASYDRTFKLWGKE
jgi:U4/U6 small nuclear ribonucleoprotein PRP4